MTEPTSDLVNDLVAEADTADDCCGSGTPIAKVMREAAARIRALEAEVGKLRGALEKVRSYNVDIAAGRLNYRPHDHIYVIESAIRSRSNGAEPEYLSAAVKNDGMTARSTAASPISQEQGSIAATRLSEAFRHADNEDWEFILGAMWSLNFGRPHDQRPMFWRKVLIEARAALNAYAPISAFGSDSADALSEVDEWTAKRAELLGWTGSAVLSGDEDFTDETRGALYTFLCSLIGYLAAGEDLERAQRSPSAVSEDVEAILGKPKSVEEMLPRTMATLAAMREESSIAPEALSEGGE